jgi:hypothetical protein
MLNETSLGEMIREVLSQAIEAAPGDPAGVMTGPEVATIAEHIARHGLLAASPADAERKETFAIVVLRKAAHREVRGLFGKLIGTIASPGTKPQVSSKGGGRQVVVMDLPPLAVKDGGDWAWWIEGDDLVFVFNGSEGADRVIAALDGQEPNAVDDPVRQELLAADGTFQPVAFGAYRFDRAGASPGEANLAGENGLSRIDFRWGFEGEESLSVVRLPSPTPRKGFMTLFDQPTIPLGELPPIPADVTDLSVISVDLAGLFDAVVSLAEQSNPAVAEQIRGFERAVQERGRFNLRDELLAALGPKIAMYTLPKPEPRRSGGNPLSGVMNALGGLGLPQFVVAIEVKDASAFTPKLDGMILALNDQIAAAVDAMQPPNPEQPEEGPTRGQSQRDRPAARPEPPKFSMTLASPRTYLLKLPDGLYGLTGYQPTITLGKHYLIFASTPVAARQCRELESAENTERWTASGELASRLPSNLTMLSVSDPSQSLPEAIASLPSTLNIAMDPSSAPPAPVTGGTAGGGSGRGGMVAAGRAGGGGFSGSSRGADSGGSGSRGSSYGSGDSSRSEGFDESQGMITSGGGYSSGGSGAPRAGTNAQAGSGAIRIDPALIPSSDAIRHFLFPALYTVSVDDSGVRLEARETLPAQWGLSGLGSGPPIPIQALPGLGGGN